MGNSVPPGWYDCSACQQRYYYTEMNSIDMCKRCLESKCCALCHTRHLFSEFSDPDFDDVCFPCTKQFKDMSMRKSYSLTLEGDLPYSFVGHTCSPWKAHCCDDTTQNHGPETCACRWAILSCGLLLPVLCCCPMHYYRCQECSQLRYGSEFYNGWDSYRTCRPCIEKKSTHWIWYTSKSQQTYLLSKLIHTITMPKGVPKTLILDFILEKRNN